MPFQLNTYFDERCFQKITGLSRPFSGYPMRILDEKETAAQVALAHAEIERAKSRNVSDDSRVGAWDSCWSNALEVGGLMAVPPYLLNQKIIRLYGGYAETSEQFMPAFQRAIVCALAQKHFRERDDIVEIGSGAGFNLTCIAREGMPKAPRLTGYDRSTAAAEAASTVARNFGLPMTVLPCGDLRRDASRVRLPSGAGVLTCGFMEQLGREWRAVLDMLMAHDGPIVHIEPFAEMYDGEDYMEHLALEYHRARGYLDGYLTELRKWATVIDEKRVSLGSQWNDGYSYVVWRKRG